MFVPKRHGHTDEKMLHQKNVLKNGTKINFEEDASEGSSGKDYIYTVYPKTGEKTFIAIYDTHNERCIFVGTASQLIKKYKPTTNNN